MKNITKYIKIGILSVMVSMISSCTDDFSEINKDPNAFNDVNPETLMVWAMQQVLDGYLGDGTLWSVVTSSRHAGEISGNSGHRYGSTSGAIGRGQNRWTHGYFVIKNCQDIINTHSENEEYANRVEMARIWWAYTQSILVAHFGPCPMKEAGSGDASVKYDTEEEIYTEILDMLKNSAAALDPEGDSYYDDPLYDGDVNKWIKFANTLRLKLALRASEAWPSLAEAHVREVMANEDGLIATDSEEAFLQFGTTVDDWSNFYDQIIYENRAENVPCMNHMFMLFMKTYKDPRVESFAEPAIRPFVITEDLADAEGSATMVSVSYSIDYLGAPVAVNAPALDEWGLEAADKPFQGFGDENYSLWNQANYMQPDLKSTILSAAQSKFCQAEAALKGWGGSKSAQAYYEEGIDLSFSKWGYTADVAAYIAQDGIAWGTSSTGDRNFDGTGSSAISDDGLEKIATQRWLSEFPWGFDAWCMQRRTRALNWPAHFGTDNNTGERFMDIQERTCYPQTETSINSDDWAAAVATFGNTPNGDNKGDHPFTLLKFAKAYQQYDWAAYQDAEYNLEFASQYYGDSVDDLVAAGKKLRTTPITPDEPLLRDEYIIN